MHHLPHTWDPQDPPVLFIGVFEFLHAAEGVLSPVACLARLDLSWQPPASFLQLYAWHV